MSGKIIVLKGDSFLKKPNFNNSIENNKRNEFKENIKQSFKTKIEEMFKENWKIVPKVAIVFSIANGIGQYVVNREIDIKEVIVSAIMFSILALLGFFPNSSKKRKQN